MTSKTLIGDNLVLHLSPLLLLIAIQSWIFLRTYTPSRHFNWSNFFTLSQTNLIGSNQTNITQINSTNRPIPSQQQLEIMFSAYANYYKIDRNLLRHIAYCESRFNPLATNGKHAGLFQFNPTTWSSTRSRMNLDPNPDLRFDAEQAIKTAAFKINQGGINAWAYCSRSLLSRS